MIRSVLLIAVIGILAIPLTAESQNLLNNPESVVFDSLQNRYLVSNWGNGAIVEIDSTGAQSYFSVALAHVAGLHIVGDTLWAASNNGSYNGLMRWCSVCVHR